MTGRTALARQNAIEAEIMPPHGFWSQADVLAQERGRLGLDEDASGGTGTTQPSALCLSGGGIRSAAFCLGVLQALAKDSLLQQFHYLSTVSGGGYIGGWLTRCIAEHEGNVGLVERSVLRTTGETEPDEIGQLRRYVNFLTPHPGLLSADTWAGVTLWIRNTLINWTVFLPIMMAVMAVPVVFVSGLVCAAGSGASGAIVWGCFGLAGLVFLTVAVFHSCAGLPSHDHEDPPARGRKSQLGLSAGQVWLRIIVPALIWSVLVPVSQAPWLASPDAGARWEAFFSSGGEPAAPAGGLWPTEMVGEVAATGRAVPVRVPVPVRTAATAHSSWEWMAGLAGSPLWQSLLLPLASFGAGLLGFLLAWRKLLGDDYVRSFAGPTSTDYRWEHSKAFLYNSPAWTFSCALSAGLLYLGIRLAAGQSVVVVAIVGPLWVIVSDVIRITAYVAVRRDGLRSELDREWLARVSGMKLRTALGLGLLVVLATVLPRAVLDHRDATGKAIYGAITFLSGGVGAWLGSSIRTAFLPAAKDGTPARLPIVGLLSGASLLVFLLCSLMLIGRLDVLVVRALEPLMALAGVWGTSAMAHGVACLCLGVAGVSIGFWLGTVINLNLFSLHAVYRNRLVRAFLGSARKLRQRHSDRFTSFDPEDDVRVSDTFDHRSVRRLYPVINVALNRTAGNDTARAARKAEPFVITPYHCGSSFLDDRNGAYVNTRRFAGREKLSGPDDKMRGITLGSAIALSGAAVSPNRGYNSSPLTAFVMTLFNLRLGAWLPNPVRAGLSDGFSRRSGPGNAVPSMLKELTGRSDDEDKFVYLSDGGHFDNLGLYSMLQRRCGRILVVDAGRDQSYGYDTLGRALEHARVDMGVKVTFIGPLKVGATALDPHGAHAHITYGDGSSGELVYIKPWVPDDAPAELRAYGRVNAHFPHDATVDQFFAERDFESYRHLGEHLAGVLIEDAMDAATPPVRSRAWPRLLGGCRARPIAAAPTGLERLFTGVRILSGAMPPRSAATPVLLAAKRSLSNASLPKARALKALMWADKGDLEQSHRLVSQHEGDPICDLVRAHLHRRRGEARKARYWYRRSGRCYAHLPIDEELETLARQLLVS